MTLQHKLLGTLAIEENGRPATVMKYSKGCALLAYLLVTNQTHSREAMADLLWEAASTATSLRSMRKLLYRLRDHVPHLTATRKQVQYQPDPATVDLHILEAALVSQDATQLDAALRLYTGPLLAGFYLEDAPRFNEWLLLVREQLRQRVWDGFEGLCAAYTAQRTCPLGIDIVRHWLTPDDLDEATHRQLMHFLAADGQIEEALAQYERCRHILREELGVEPNAATTAVAAQIKELVLPPEDELAEPGPLPAQSVLPFHRNATFTGRQEPLLQLAALLLPQAGEPSLPKTAVVSGMGGLGKTQLAVEFAYRYGRFFPGGVYWLSFADADNIAQEVAAAGSERGLRLYRTTDKLPLAQRVSQVQHAWQEPVSRLLIFDNCEKVDLALQWLPISGGCAILITSRRGHWPKEMPLTETPLATLPRAESISLLRQLAPHLSVAAVTPIAAELGDLPLALQMAGHFLAEHPEVTPAAYLAQLQNEQILHHNSLQGAFSRYSPTGHELHVARTFASGFERLDRPDLSNRLARRLLATAVCLAPNEPMPAALLTQAVAASVPADQSEAVAAGLKRLLLLGFVTATAGMETIFMHQLIAQFAQESVASLLPETRGEVETAVIQQLREHETAETSLLTLPLSVAHLRTITNQALAHSTPNAAPLATLFGAHLNLIASYSEAETYLQRAYALLAETNSLVLAEATNHLGSLAFNRADFSKALTYHQEALAIRQQQLGQNHPLTAHSINQISVALIELDDYAAAIGHIEQALAIREQTLGAEHPLTLSTVNNLGAVHNLMGHYEKARFYFARVLTGRERVLGPDHIMTATALNNLGDLLSRHGEHEAGLPFLKRAVVIREQQLGFDHPLTLACATNFGKALSEVGEYEAAQDYLQRALTAAQQKLGSNHPLSARIFNTLGTLYTEMGKFAQAQRHLEEALAMRERIRGPEHLDTGYTLLCLGENYLAAGDRAQARATLQRALAVLGRRLVSDNHYIHRIHKHLAELD